MTESEMDVTVIEVGSLSRTSQIVAVVQRDHGEGYVEQLVLPIRAMDGLGREEIARRVGGFLYRPCRVVISDGAIVWVTEVSRG